MGSIIKFFKSMFNAIASLLGRKSLTLDQAEDVKIKQENTLGNLGYKIIEHSTHIREENFNKRFLRWCIGTNTHPESKDAVKKYIQFFCAKYNYHGIKRIVGYKGRAYYVCIVRKRYAA